MTDDKQLKAVNEGSLYLYPKNNYPKCKLPSQDKLIDLYSDQLYIEKAEYDRHWHGLVPFRPNVAGLDAGCWNLASRYYCSNSVVLNKCRKSCEHFLVEYCKKMLCKAHINFEVHVSGVIELPNIVEVLKLDNERPFDPEKFRTEQCNNFCDNFRHKFDSFRFAQNGIDSFIESFKCKYNECKPFEDSRYDFLHELGYFGR